MSATIKKEGLKLESETLHALENRVQQRAIEATSISQRLEASLRTGMSVFAIFYGTLYSLPLSALLGAVAMALAPRLFQPALHQLDRLFEVMWFGLSARVCATLFGCAMLLSWLGIRLHEPLLMIPASLLAFKVGGELTIQNMRKEKFDAQLVAPDIAELRAQGAELKRSASRKLTQVKAEVAKEGWFAWLFGRRAAKQAEQVADDVTETAADVKQAVVAKGAQVQKQAAAAKKTVDKAIADKTADVKKQAAGAQKQATKAVSDAKKVAIDKADQTKATVEKTVAQGKKKAAAAKKQVEEVAADAKEQGAELVDDAAEAVEEKKEAAKGWFGSVLGAAEEKKEEIEEDVEETAEDVEEKVEEKKAKAKGWFGSARAAAEDKEEIEEDVEEAAEDVDEEAEEATEAKPTEAKKGWFGFGSAAETKPEEEEQDVEAEQEETAAEVNDSVEAAEKDKVESGWLASMIGPAATPDKAVADAAEKRPSSAIRG